MNDCEIAVAQMQAYGKAFCDSTNWKPALHPGYAINILRGYVDLAKRGKLPDLAIGVTPTDKAYAYFDSPAWDDAAFLAEWARCEAQVTT